MSTLPFVAAEPSFPAATVAVRQTAVVALAFPTPDIAVLTFDDPAKGANVLSSAVLDEFEKALNELQTRSGLTGLVIRSGKPGMFIAGADLREFAASLDASSEKIAALCNRGRRLFQRLSQVAFVTVAAIDGICVGGGAELAIWCDHRLMTSDPKTHFGFPEVKLGLFPGWGGTARASRIVGLGNAVELVTGGESIDGREAVAMGLATDVTTPAALQSAAVALIRAEQKSGRYLRDRQRLAQPIDVNETELMFLGVTASGYIQSQTKGQYPAPEAALEMMLAGAALDIDAACTLEADGMSQLFGTPVNRALINLFFLSDHNKKDPGVGRPAKARELRSVSVVGSGIMGRGIAAASLKRELTVTLADASSESLAAGIGSVLEEVSYSKALKGPDAAKAVSLAPRLRPAASDADIGASDLVIEAIVENRDAKQQLFARIEPKMRPTAVLATNTSTIQIAKLAKDLARPERFCGIHFFNPVRKMPLVEIIRGPQTSDDTIATAVAYAKRIGKSPIVVNDGPGFLVNRLLFPYMNEAVQLLTEGVEIEAIDRAAKAFGMPLGPVALYDLVGLDTAFYAGRVMWEAFPDRVLGSLPLMVLVKAGRWGQKTGRGFYAYPDNSGRGVPDPDLARVIGHLISPPQKMEQPAIQNRLFLPMVLEATRVLEERLVRDVRDVDLGLIYGLGFPPYRGGLLFWADTLGAKKIVELLAPLEHLGARFEITPLLREMAASGKKFYDLRV